jgi:hypothetical protein
MASASAREGQPVHHGKILNWLAKVFERDSGKLNWARALVTLDLMLVPLVVFWAIGHEQYLFSAIFGVLFAELSDPGGSYWQSASRIFIFGAVGAGLTALGFGIGGDAWGWLVLAAFAVTLVAGLALMFGVRRFVAAYLLNVWFIITLAVAYSFHHHTHITQYTWAQVVAWSGGAALWIVIAFAVWLIRGRHDSAPPIAEMPGDISRRKLTPPIIAFVVLRALVIAGTVAIAFGALGASHGYWMAIAAIVAMKPTLEASTLMGAQRVAGALIGGVAAGLLLLIPANVHGLNLLLLDSGLTTVAIVILIHGVGIRLWNYALYYSAISAGVLLLLDLGQPTNYAAEGYRVLWALCGVAIAVAVMFLAGLLGKRRTAKAPPQPASATRPEGGVQPGTVPEQGDSSHDQHAGLGGRGRPPRSPRA